MDAFFYNVRGCILDIEEYHSSIPFTSPSDSLFASLFFKYKDTMELRLLDDLLLLFRHPDFHSDRVTFKEAEDISVHVADQRQAIMTMRNKRGDTKEENTGNRITEQPRAWKLVLELVAEYLDSQRVPFYRTRANEYGPKVCDVNQTFAEMSLVGRSWAEVAQRCCRRRVHVQIRHGCGIQSLLQNPAVGPWVQELSIIGGSTGGWDEKTHSMLEVPRLLCKVLGRCPNIRHLRLNTPFYTKYTADKGPREDILRSIGTLRYLESLWLGEDCGLGSDNIRKLASTISSLRYLDTLGLENSSWQTSTDASDGMTLKDMSHPSASLRFLSLLYTNNITTALMTWLLSPDRESHITRLEISLRDMLDCVDGITTLRPALKNCATEYVTKLQIVVDTNEKDVTLVLGLFPSLQSLSLFVSMIQYDEDNYAQRSPILLPASITEFIFCFTNHYNRTFDAYALATIKANPYLRKVSFAYIPWNFGRDPISEVKFENTVDYAAKNGVDLNVMTRETRPHFLDI